MSTLKVNQIYEADGSKFRFNTDIVHIQSQTGADLGGALIFDNLDTATYRSFILYFAMVPASNVDGYYPNLRLRTGGSSGADETGSHYSFGYGYTYPNDGWQHISRADYTYAGLAITVGALDTYEGINGVLHFTPCRSGDSFNTGSGGSFAHWQIGLHHEAGAWRGTHGNMVYNENSTTNHTGFKIYMGTGSTESGGFDEYKYSFYGVKG
tara:strand:- start:26 stop:655 length:630 start_codon:yes stop_codon:yes gene_type:complete